MQRVVHPGRALPHLVLVQPDAPALGALDHLATERFGHRLVAEADADQPGLTSGLSQEADQLGNPTQLFIHARRRPGQHIGTALRDAGRQLAPRYVEGHGVAAWSEQPPYHRAVGAEPRDELFGRGAAFEDADRRHARTAASIGACWGVRVFITRPGPWAFLG